MPNPWRWGVGGSRESLKRVETFAGWTIRAPVRVTIEEIFILMLQALGRQRVEGSHSAFISFCLKSRIPSGSNCLALFLVPRSE